MFRLRCVPVCFSNPCLPGSSGSPQTAHPFPRCSGKPPGNHPSSLLPQQPTYKSNPVVSTSEICPGPARLSGCPPTALSSLVYWDAFLTAFLAQLHTVARAIRKTYSDQSLYCLTPSLGFTSCSERDPQFFPPRPCTIGPSLLLTLTSVISPFFFCVRCTSLSNILRKPDFVCSSGPLHALFLCLLWIYTWLTSCQVSSQMLRGFP